MDPFRVIAGRPWLLEVMGDGLRSGEMVETPWAVRHSGLSWKLEVILR